VNLKTDVTSVETQCIYVYVLVLYRVPCDVHISLSCVVSCEVMHVMCSLSTGEFAGNLPDYQKVEIMIFVMSKISSPAGDR